MSEHSLVAVIVTHNRIEQLKTTVARLREEGDALSGIVVFDNGSHDGTREWLASPTNVDLFVETSPENIGGAGGFAAGMRAANRQFDPDWLVLMDDDARPLPSVLSTFMSLDRTTAAAWATRVTYPNGVVCDMNRPWKNPFGSLSVFAKTLLRGRDGFHTTDADQTVQPSDGASFVGLFLSRHAVAQIGYPDPALFIYGDDVLYTLRLTRAGMALNYDPSLGFEHDCETGAAHATLSPLWKTYFYHRNQMFVYRAAAGPFLFPFLAALKVAIWRLSAFRYGGDRQTYLHLLRLALRDCIKGQTSRTRRDIEAIINAH